MIASGPQGAYEALQLYRSRAMRFKTKAKTQGDIMNCLTTLADGAVCLLQNKYETAGGELANLFVDTVEEKKVLADDDVRTLALKIDEAFPPDSNSRAEYLKAAVSWTKTTGTLENGDAMLQTQYGECLWLRGDKSAANHYAAGESPAMYNAKIFEKYKEKSQQLERDQSLTMGIVNFLALENLRDAFELMRQYKKYSKDRKFKMETRLLRFNDFLLQTSRRDAGPLFKELVNSYAADLDFDETVPKLLMGPIAMRLFGIQPKVNPLMSMLQTMLK